MPNKKKKKVTRRGSALTTPGARKKSVVLSEFEKVVLQNEKERIKAESEYDEWSDKLRTELMETSPSYKEAIRLRDQKKKASKKNKKLKGVEKKRKVTRRGKKRK